MWTTQQRNQNWKYVAVAGTKGEETHSVLQLCLVCWL